MFLDLAFALIFLNIGAYLNTSGMTTNLIWDPLKYTYSKDIGLPSLVTIYTSSNLTFIVSSNNA